MYKAKIIIKEEGIIKDQYFFSDQDKGNLLLCATSWFLGYVRAFADYSEVRLTMPCVMSIDGYKVWSDNNRYTLELVNAEGEIITDINSIK